MRWILVFILLYLIPLRVLFKNYKSFRRACIYGSIYVMLATTIVITNTYLSSFKIIEETFDYDNNLVLETYLEKSDTSELKYKENIRFSDLKKIDMFRSEVYSIEKKALIPMRECLPYTTNLQKTLSNLLQVKEDVLYARDMCDDVVTIYENMKVPTLSKEEYTQRLNLARLNVKKTYELRTKAMESSIKLIDTKNPIYINEITKYLKLSDKEIENFKNNIDELKKIINEK